MKSYRDEVIEKIVNESVEEFDLKELLGLHESYTKTLKHFKEKLPSEYFTMKEYFEEIYFKVLKIRLNLDDAVIIRIRDIAFNEENLEDIGLLNKDIVIKVSGSNDSGSKLFIVNEDNSHTPITDDAEVTYISKILESSTQK